VEYTMWWIYEVNICGVLSRFAYLLFW